jgi:hypothetical protein
VKLTLDFMAIGTIVILGFDYYIYRTRGVKDTISRATIKYPIISFAWGVLIGHLFF